MHKLDILKINGENVKNLMNYVNSLWKIYILTFLYAKSPCIHILWIYLTYLFWGNLSLWAKIFNLSYQKYF